MHICWTFAFTIGHHYFSLNLGQYLVLANITFSFEAKPFIDVTTFMFVAHGSP